MPAWCMVPGCDNYRKKREEGVSVSYHRLPTDVERCKEWLRAMKNPKYDDNAPASVLGNLRVCSLHFAADDYNRDMQSEMMGGTIKKLLKTSAVPSLFGSDIGHGEGEPREKRVKLETEEQSVCTYTATVSVPSCGTETRHVMLAASAHSQGGLFPEGTGGSACRILPAVRHVASQTDPPETKSVGTQLSMKTLQNHFRSTATQARVPSRDCGVCTLTFPLDSPLLFLQPTIAKRPSKRPRLSLTDEEEGPSECSLSMVVHEAEDST